jgi:hypothetical protein
MVWEAVKNETVFIFSEIKSKRTFVYNFYKKQLDAGLYGVPQTILRYRDCYE